MSDIALSGVTVTLSPEDVFVPEFPLRYSFPTLAFGNGSDTYATHGIPMPLLGQLGMERVIKFLEIEQPANGFVYAYDRTVRTASPVGPNGTLRIFQGNGGTISGAIFTGDAHAPTGNVAATPAASGGTPAGTVASANHAHDLVILANGAGAGTQIIGAGANTANHALVSNTAGGDTIPGGNTANKGGVELTTPANSTFAGAALATHVHGAQAFTGDSYTPTGNITGTVILSAGALAELGHVAVIATVLRLKVTGQ